MQRVLRRPDWWELLTQAGSEAAARKPAPRSLLAAIALDVHEADGGEACGAYRGDGTLHSSDEGEDVSEGGVEDEVLLEGREAGACCEMLALLTSLVAAAPPHVALKCKQVVFKVVQEAAWSREACLRASAQALVSEWLAALLAIRPNLAPCCERPAEIERGAGAEGAARPGAAAAAPAVMWALPSLECRRTVQEVVDSLSRQAFEALDITGGCQSQEAAAAIKLDGTSRQAAALGLLRAVVRGAGPLLSRESWISEQPAQLDSCRASDADMPERAERGVGEGGGEGGLQNTGGVARASDMWARQTSAGLSQADAGMEWLSTGWRCDAQAGRWSQGREHNVQRMINFEAQTLDSKWEDQWADGLCAGAGSSVSFSCSYLTDGCWRSGLDGLRLSGACGASLPLGGRWLWLAGGAGRGASSGAAGTSGKEGGTGGEGCDWGRQIVAQVAGCLKAVLPSMLDAAVLADWTLLAGDLLYQPGLLVDLAAQRARTAADLEALSPCPSAGAHTSAWTHRPLRAHAAMLSLRFWAYGAYLAPLKRRPPASLAPISAALQSLCLHEAERVRHAALSLLPLALQLHPHMLPALIADADAYLRSRPALCQKERGGEHDQRAGRGGEATQAMVVLDVLAQPQCLVRAISDATGLMRVFELVGHLSRAPALASAVAGRAAVSRIWRCMSCLWQPACALPEAPGGTGALHQHLEQMRQGVARVCQLEAWSSEEECRRVCLCLSVLWLAGSSETAKLCAGHLAPQLVLPVPALPLAVGAFDTDVHITHLQRARLGGWRSGRRRRPRRGRGRSGGAACIGAQVGGAERQGLDG